MDDDIRSKATDIFNILNRYLNLINYKTPEFIKNKSPEEKLFEDLSTDTFESKIDQIFEDKLKAIANNDICELYSDPKFNAYISKIVWEDDFADPEPKTTQHSQISGLETQESIINSESSVSEPEDSKDDDELISNLSSDRGLDSDDNVYFGTADSNFTNYTYWCVETGDNVSTTVNPLYFNAENCKVSLLQESEAFVAQGFWGSDKNLFKYTPRHLLLQVTQIANRAFFDPDYRKYLQLNYV